MAMSAIWIRHNMLGTVEQQERKLTDAELRVQRSLEKLSIPDWYLNKQSNPPKILRNDTPIESRPPSWKNPGSKRPSGIDTTCKQFAESCTLSQSGANNANNNNIVDTGTYKISRHIKLVMQSRGPRRSPSRTRRNQKEEMMDTDIPKVKLPTHVSKTFPKISPSRKIENINIVFPPGPPLDISNSSVPDSDSADTKYQTFVVKKQIPECDKQTEGQSNENDAESCCTPTKSYANYSFRTFSPDSCDVSLRTGNMECSFTVRAVSTPKQSPVNLFSLALLEEIPRMKKLPSEIVAEKTFIKDSPKKSPPTDWLNKTMIDGTPRSKKKLLPSRNCSPNPSTPRQISSAHMILANRFRSLEPMVFERDNTKYPQSPRKSYIAVREIAKKFDPKGSKSCKSPDLQSQLEAPTASPCTRFFYSKKKSTELENIVQNTQATRGKGLVRGIIEELSEKSKTWTLRGQSRVNLSNQNYVKEVVNALEKGDTLKAKKVLLNKSRSMLDEDTESYSESDGKSAVFSTSMSLKDTDSSDCDQRTPTLKSDEESQFDYSTLASRQTLLDSRVKGCQTDEEDSVYWIPVTRYKLPRTSSLLSMISRLPANGGYQSPCVSPIRSDSDSSECANPAVWNATYKKNTITKKLFRIDETVVTDSGYSDRSNVRNVSKSSLADDTWSEETQHDDSGSDSRESQLNKSASRRKTMVGLKSILV